MWHERTMNPAWSTFLRTLMVIAIVVAVTVLGGAGFILLAGHAPTAAFTAIMDGVFAHPLTLAIALEDVAPLLLCGLAAACAFRAGVLNIGGQGQFLLGAMSMMAVATTWRPPGPGWLIVTLGCFAAITAGAGWALIAGALERWRGVNAVLSTILLNYIAIAVVLWLIEGPFGDPTTTAPQTALLAASDRLPILLPLSHFHIGVIISAVLAVGWWLVESRTRVGLELRMMGGNAEAAQALGVAVPRRRLHTFALSGAFAGLAGAMQTAGVTYYLSDSMVTRSSFGYLGVAVALLGALHPLGVVAAALFFALLDGSVRALEQELQVPRDLADLLKGVALIVALVGGAWLARSRQRRIREAA